MACQSGIYQILNNITNKIYIGSTACFSNRWSHHRGTLRRGTHSNKHLQSSWNKYGELSFRFSILEIVDDIANLISVEQKYIDLLRPQYNKRLIADSNIGTKRPMLLLDREQRSKDTRKISNEIIETIQQMWSDGIYMQKHLADLFKLHPTTISRIVNKRRYYTDTGSRNNEKSYTLNKYIDWVSVMNMINSGINQVKTAKVFNISQSTISRKLKKTPLAA